MDLTQGCLHAGCRTDLRKSDQVHVGPGLRRCTARVRGGKKGAKGRARGVVGRNEGEGATYVKEQESRGVKQMAKFKFGRGRMHRSAWL